MLIACWSAKGGAGTTVVAASLAAMATRSTPRGALLADLAGDAPAVLGVPEPQSPGLAGWLARRDTRDSAALDAEVVDLERCPGLSLLSRGDAELPTGEPAESRTERLGRELDAIDRVVVADCGTLRGHGSPAAAVARAAAHSWLVIRPDYLSLRHASHAPLRPTGAVMLQQPGPSLGRADVEGVLRVPVVAELTEDAATARAVDAGLLSGRLPRTIVDGLQPALARAVDGWCVQPHDPAAARAPITAEPPEASL